MSQVHEVPWSFTEGRCSYCGSMSVEEATKVLSEPGMSFSGADQKYGYPHKFYLGGKKFYTTHLRDATPEQLAAFNERSQSCLGIRFFLDEKGLGYEQPRINSFYGWQTYGKIGSDGKPVFAESSPIPPPLKGVKPDDA